MDGFPTTNLNFSMHFQFLVHVFSPARSIFVYKYAIGKDFWPAVYYSVGKQ